MGEVKWSAVIFTVNSFDCCCFFSVLGEGIPVFFYQLEYRAIIGGTSALHKEHWTESNDGS